MRIIGVIPARYGSSRFPGKPLADICGKPMVWWVYHQASKVSELSDVFVATDDVRIKNVCEKNGMKVMMTSPTHNTGTDRVAEVARLIEGDIYINIQGDEPLIPPEMIQTLIHIFDDPTVNFGTLKTQILDESELAATSTVKVVTDVNNDALYFSRSIIPSQINNKGKCVVYRHVGIYGYKRDFLLWFSQTPQTELELSESIEPLRALEHGYKIRVLETNLSSVGVDYPEHIKIVEKQVRDRI